MPVNRFLLGSVSLAALGLSQTALADPGTDAPANIWSGPYIGGNIGGAFLDNDTDIDFFIIPGSQDDNGDEGITGGGQVGWNFQHDQFVFGAEGDFNLLDVEGDTLFRTKTPGVVETDFDWFATVRGRAGVAVDHTLIYATLGLAIARGEIEVSNGGPVSSNTDTLVGLAAGGGVEHRFTDALSGRIEYLYADMESISTPFFGTSVSSSTELHFLRAGLNYHFCFGVGC